LIIPHLRELETGGRLDPSDESAYTVMPGLEHKYASTALLLISGTCEGICRYCFRKRVFMEAAEPCLHDLPAAVSYIRRHPEITNVLLTGGDPLTLPTAVLADTIAQLKRIEHVQIVRIGTRMPVYNPYRISEDSDLISMISTFSTSRKRIYFMNHFAHPREYTDAAIDCLDAMLRAGAVLTNQCPLIRGVNDSPEILIELFRTAAACGVVPYYVFQCRPAIGNHAYTVPVEEGYDILEAAKSRVSGLAKRIRFVMSHTTGKIEIIGITEGRVYFKYHRAESDENNGRILICKSNPEARWLDDYLEVTQDYPANMPYRRYGPQ